MRFSLELPTQRVDRPGEFVTAEAIAAVARAAADAGFDAVNVTDHPAPDGKWLDHGGHHALDPFVALAVAAAASPTVGLHTNIYVAAYRNPFLGAKQVHSLQVLSGGRVILGVAAGYLKPEFAAVGVDHAERGARLDDALDVLDAAFAGDDVVRQAHGYSARGVRFRPVAPQGRPPVWVGGNSKPAMARAARYEGWSPFHTAGYAMTSRTSMIESLETLGSAIAWVRGEVANRTPDRRFDVCWSESQSPDAGSTVDERCSRIAALAALGVTWLTVSLPADSRDELLAAIAAFGRDVVAATSTV